MADDLDDVMLCTRIPKRLRERLKIAAITNERTMAEIVAEAVVQRLDQLDRERSR